MNLMSVMNAIFHFPTDGLWCSRVALGASVSAAAGLGFLPSRTQARGAPLQNPRTPASAAARRQGQPPEAQPPFPPAPAFPSTGYRCTRAAAFRLCRTAGQVQGSRCDHRHRYFAEHAGYGHRPYQARACQADRAGSSQSAQGRPGRADRLRRRCIPRGTLDARQGGRAYIDQ